MARQFLSVLFLTVNLCTANGLRLEQVCLNPAGGTAHYQWVQMYLPVGMAPLALRDVGFRVGDRRRSLAVLGSNGRPVGSIPPATLAPGSRVTVIESDPTTSWGSIFQGCALATLDAESLGDGKALAPGDVLSLEGPGVSPESIPLRQTPPGFSYIRRFDRADSPWVISPGPAVPTGPVRPSENTGLGLPVKVVLRCSGPWPWGTAASGYFELLDEAGDAAWTLGGTVQVQGRGDLNLVPLGEGVPPLRTETPVTWPLRWGQTPPFRFQAFSRGANPFTFTYGNRVLDLTLDVAGWGTSPTPRPYISELRPGSLIGTAFVEVTGHLPPGEAWKMRFTSDDLGYEKEFSIRSMSGEIHLLAPEFIPGVPCRQVVTRDASAYAEGTVMLLSGDGSPVDVVHCRKGDYPLGNVGSLFRRFPGAPALKKDDLWVSSSSYPPSPGIINATPKGDGVRFSGPTTWYRPTDVRSCALESGSLISVSARLWSRQGQGGPILLSNETMGPAQPLRLAPDGLLDALTDFKGDVVLVVDGQDLLTGQKWTRRYPLRLSW